MKLDLQTRFTGTMNLYDTDAPSTGKSSLGAILKAIIKPYVRVTQGSVVLAEVGKPYPDESAKWQFLFGIAGAAIVIGTGSLIYNLGKKRR